MLVALCVLGGWVVVSVPMGLLLGRACGLNQLSLDGGEASHGHDGLPRSGTVLDPDRTKNVFAAA